MHDDSTDLAAKAERIDARERFLRVEFASPPKRTADFHYFWLRHNCDCCRHPQTRERTLCSSRIPLEIAPASVALSGDGNEIQIAWNEDGDLHCSVYPIPWLWENAYARDRDNASPPPSDLSLIEVDRRGLGSAARLADVCLDYVRCRGAVLVRDAGDDTEAIIDELAGHGLRVIETHFGRIEDLRTDNTTNKNTDQLGYTDAPVDLHTDQPFIAAPPRYQMLHCMRPADEGGDSIVADAIQAALYLKSIDAGAFDMLTRVPVRFHRRQKAFESLHRGPIVELRDGGVFRIRSSYFTMAPHLVPFDEMEQWYRSYNRFAALVDDPRHHYRFLLREGDFLLYDNFRMLHARTAFTGSRWVRGVYFNPGGNAATSEPS